MTGIIHLRPTSRVSRRTLIASAASVAMVGRVSLHAQSPEGSPMARGGTYLADARDRLRDLLSLVPASSLLSDDPAMQLFDWVDYDAQLAASGIIDPYAAGTAIVPALSPLATSDPLFQNAMVPELPDLIGFRPLDVHQVLVTGGPPERLLIYRGGFDATAMPEFWESTGYGRASGDHGDYWMSRGDNELDIQDPFSRIVFANMNYATVLDDTTIAFAPTLAIMEAVLALAAGDGDAATNDRDLDVLIGAMPDDAVSVVAMPGEAFLATGIVPENPGMDAVTTVEEVLAESNDAVGPMPQLLLSLSGVTAGVGSPALPENGGTPIPPSHPEAQAFMMFLTGSEEDAASAAQVAYWRLENMQSPTTGEVYSERFVPANPVEEATEGAVMIVRFTGWPASNGGWRIMIVSRDSWPFAWLP